ncbi:MAG: C4-dicarboxylate ABC transporter substrate-binding protein [Candidatus Parabeggiatoa sp. nov. 1]|nr:MAG: C4-dicarboxylate ABC transporter substrate-binding protein [Gammaproteobacteria bacterium]
MKCKYCKIVGTVIASLVFIFLSFYIAYQFVDPPPPNELRIATGREDGGYHAFALEYQTLLAEDKFQLDIQPTAGSIEVIQRLKSGDVSIGLVQGGTKGTISDDGLKSLGSLFYEPVWLFHRKNIPLEYLFELRGKRIAVGEEGSGTRPIALQLLQDNEVTQDNTTLLALSSNEATLQLKAGKIDAAFFVMSPKADRIFQLLKNSDIELLSFKRDLAYRGRYSFLTGVKIGEGMIDLKKNIPSQEKTLLAATASLVAREDLHSDLVPLLLTTLKKIHQKGGLLEKPKQFPSDKFVEFPMNPDASHYLQSGPSWLHKIFPFWIASTLDRLKILLIPLIAMMLPLLKGVLPLYSWGIRFKIFRWYSTLREIDSEIAQITDLTAIDAEIKRMKALEQEILEQVSVPLSYMGEFYSLRVHTQLVLSRLKERGEDVLAHSA